MKKIRLLKYLLILGMLPVLKTLAFSPYENFLQSDRPRQVGLLAALPPAGQDECLKVFKSLLGETEARLLAAKGITNLSGYHREIGDTTWLVLHFVLDQDNEYLEAAEIFANATKATRELSSLVEPHPRAERFKTDWLQMEWINYIRGKDVPGPASGRLMIVTTIVPEKEQEYRSLHQTVWPGVVDQVIRSNNRDLSIFLAEIDDLLVEFLYVEYVGKDQAKDDRMSQTDAINHRWWKLTDACQKGLPGVEGNWTTMEPFSRQLK